MDVFNAILNGIMVLISICGSCFMVLVGAVYFRERGMNLMDATLAAMVLTATLYAAMAVFGFLTYGSGPMPGCSSVIAAVWYLMALRHLWNRRRRGRLKRLLARVKEAAGHLVVVPVPAN